jgi:cyclopropane fatty-acyl-phospholipid synthase-like methyltransferase
MENLPFSESCEQNKSPILAVLSEAFSDRKNVLEIGSGTGQHAIYFGKMLPHLTWQTSDLAENHNTIRAWLKTANLKNVLPPLLIDANVPDWQLPFTPDAIFSANAVHIMGWHEVENLFTGIGRNVKAGGLLCLYGPFNYGGKFTSMSNAQFDELLNQ